MWHEIRNTWLTEPAFSDIDISDLFQGIVIDEGESVFGGVLQNSQLIYECRFPSLRSAKQSVSVKFKSALRNGGA